MSGAWRGTLWTLLVTLCVVIIRCTETFWSPCIIKLVLDWKIVHILLIIDNTTGMPRLKKKLIPSCLVSQKNWFPVVSSAKKNWFPVVSSAKKNRFPVVSSAKKIDSQLFRQPKKLIPSCLVSQKKIDSQLSRQAKKKMIPSCLVSQKKKRYNTLNLTMRIDGDLIQDRIQNLSQNREPRQYWGRCLFYKKICCSSRKGSQNEWMLLAATIQNRYVWLLPNVHGLPNYNTSFRVWP